jgi:hypothetical protein
LRHCVHRELRRRLPGRPLPRALRRSRLLSIDLRINADDVPGRPNRDLRNVLLKRARKRWSPKAKLGRLPGVMRQMTERSRKWMESVKANFADATGKPVEAWVERAKSRGYDKDIKVSRKWLREHEGLTTVQANFVLLSLFPESDASEEEELLAAQYSGKKALLRPIYDKLATVARGFGKDVMIAPRKSQVTFARQVTFAVVRAGAQARLDLALRLPGEKPTARLVTNRKATGSDPTHTVSLVSAKEVDRDVVKWMKIAYEKAKR